jgi:hypothetical protein
MDELKLERWISWNTSSRRLDIFPDFVIDHSDIIRLFSPARHDWPPRYVSQWAARSELASDEIHRRELVSSVGWEVRPPLRALFRASGCTSIDADVD